MLTPADSIFVDTNVLLYSLDIRNPSKQQKAHAWLDYLWKSGSGRLSWQVLNEFYVNAVRRTGTSPVRCREMLNLFSHWTPCGIDRAVVERGWYWIDKAQLSYWDSLILASAERLGCAFLLSEDFQAGRKYGDVRVIDPFQISPPSST